jgi:hypothetical protein
MLAASAALSLALTGCGSNLGSADRTSAEGAAALGSDPSGNKYAGAAACIGCHEGFTWSSDAVTEYLGSKHVVHSSHITAASGECLECHDPVGDGGELVAFIDATNVPASGLAAVTCEACHGGGGEHYGVGPMPTPQPGFAECGQCHNADMDHNSYHPFADEIVENYQLGMHAKSLGYFGDGASPVTARCARCHSDEGFRQYAAATAGLGHDLMEEAFQFTAALEGATPVACRTCHDPHSGELRAMATETTPTVGTGTVDATEYSAQFNLCTSCHQVFLDSTWDETSETYSYALDATVYADPTLIEYHNPVINGYASVTQIISDTHFAGTDAAGSPVTGYNINAGSDHACSSCHDVHGATKFEQAWAGPIAEAWGNTADFHGDYDNSAFSYPQSEDCAQCHSGTEFVKLTEGQAADRLDADMAGVIACVSCHDLQAKDLAGTAFELGALRELATFSFPNELSLAAADDTYTAKTVDGLGANALCMTCHSGRKGMNDVATANLFGDDGIEGNADDDTTYNFADFNVHYKIAGATQYGTMAKGGYEFNEANDGAAFADNMYASKFEHVDSDDSCIECHSPHDGSLDLTSCATCHVGVTVEADLQNIRMAGSIADYDGDGNATEGMYAEVEGLKTLLYNAVTAAGIVDVGHYPYYSNITTHAQLKAVYNMHFVNEDPGGYAHNAAYTIELLYDSLKAMGADVSALTRNDSGHFNTAGEPYRHWDEDGEMSGSCAPCHSGEGAKFALTGDTTSTFSEDTKGISQSLTCEACHAAPFDPATLNAPGAYTASYTVDAVSPTLPDLGDSNLCVNCHTGRGNMDSLVGSDLTNVTATKTHYFTAAGTLFAASTRMGYEYTGPDYADMGYFAHDGIGLNADSPETGLGPCVACHLDLAANHDFNVGTKDAAGEFTAIKNNASVCSACHTGGFALTATILQEEAEGYHEALEVLNQALIARDVKFYASYPYFFPATLDPAQAYYGNHIKDWSALGEGILGAAHNYNYLHHEPGAYAHNRYYAKRLIFDSIDWLDNGALDAAITIDADTYPEAAVWFGAAPGTTGSYSVTTRPGD